MYKDPNVACEKVIEMAERMGSLDNLSIMVNISSNLDLYSSWLAISNEELFL